MTKEIMFHCLSCHQLLKCDVSLIGRNVMCPLCKKQIVVAEDVVADNVKKSGVARTGTTEPTIARLVLQSADKKTLCATVLPDKGLTLGRDVGCGFQLNKPEVSRRHARITYGQNGWVIRDLNSRNGFFVNDKKQLESPLVDGDVIRICGDEIVFECADNEEDRKTTVLEIDTSDEVEQQTMVFGSRS